MVFLKHRTTEPAIYVFENALKARPDVPKLWMGLGLSYYLASKLEQAEKALRQALALDPRYETAYIVLGDLLTQAGKVDEAVEVFRKAIDVRPDLYLPYYYYGQASARQGKENCETGIQMLKKAIALNPFSWDGSTKSLATQLWPLSIFGCSRPQAKKRPPKI